MSADDRADKGGEFCVRIDGRLTDAPLHDLILAEGDARPESAVVRRDRYERLRRLGLSDAEIASLYGAGALALD